MPRVWSGRAVGLAVQGLCLAGMLAAAGCGGSAADAAAGMAAAGDAGPFGEVMSDNGGLRLEVRTGPYQPPTRGLSSVYLSITDAQSGEPVSDLELTVVPWMPAMGHGTSIKPSVVPMDEGEYAINNVNMFMGGLWDLRITIAGAVTDRATIHFSIR